jgi:hypothetical protein
MVPTLSADIIISGGTGSPDVFGPATSTGLTLLASTTQTVNPGSPFFNATYTEYVYSDTSGTVAPSPQGGSTYAGLCRNCLDFFIEVTNAGPGIIERISASNFAGFATDVGYNTAGGAGIAPNTVDRSADGSVIGFNYLGSNELEAGQNTMLLEIQTDALAYTNGTVTVQDGAAGFNIGFSPSSAPEPGTMALFGLGFIGLGMAKGNRKRKA